MKAAHLSVRVSVFFGSSVYSPDRDHRFWLFLSVLRLHGAHRGCFGSAPSPHGPLARSGSDIKYNNFECWDGVCDGFDSLIFLLSVYT